MSDWKNNNTELGWDDEINNEAGFTDIADGDYDFIVDHYERAKVTNPDSKYNGSNMAVIYCNILTEGEPQIRTNIILHSKMQWKLAQFFISLGLMEDKEDAKLKMNWNAVGGSRGRCRVIHKPNYNNPEKEHLEIDEFLKPAPGQKKWSGGF